MPKPKKFVLPKTMPKDPDECQRLIDESIWHVFEMTCTFFDEFMGKDDVNPTDANILMEMYVAIYHEARKANERVLVAAGIA